MSMTFEEFSKYFDHVHKDIDPKDLQEYYINSYKEMQDIIDFINSPNYLTRTEDQDAIIQEVIEGLKEK